MTDNGEHMSDSELVASIVAGDPDGLAEAYDRYASALFGYCRSLLREPADAADAVQDTFVIAASRLSGLRDPDQLRPWLFAVARNECLRRLRSREAASALDENAEQADETVDVGGEAERAETRALLLAAVGGLNPAERDVIIQMLHGLDVAEIALVLGVSRNHVHSLFSRARHQLEASVASLIVARSGREDCQALDTMLTGWDGQLTVPLRKQISKHIDKCAVCSGRRRRELTPALLLGLSPGALLGAFAAHAAGAAGVAPAAPAAVTALRDQALQMATSQDLHAQAYRSALWRSHASFGQNGFPKPVMTSHHVLPRVPHPRVAAAGGAAAVVAALVVVATLAGGHHIRFSGGGPLAGGQPPGAAPSGTASGIAPGVPGQGTAPGASPSGAASSGGGRGVPASPGASASSQGSSPSPSGTGSTTATPTSVPPTSVPPTGTTSPTPQPTSTGQPTPAPTNTATTAPPPPSGTLAVSPLSVVLTPVLGKTITLTAEGGPVNWSIAEPASLLGELIVSPSSGTLAANQSVQVTISVSGLASLDTQLTVSPGGQQVTVVLGLG
jgi:RNA polymerase sigma factor (sigma-70 family)